MKSYINGICDNPLLGMTIGEKLDEVVKRFPNNEALVVIHQNIRWTYKVFNNQVAECSKALISRGIKKGDRVGIWSPNRWEWTVLQFATANVGAILVNINPAYRLHELYYALKQSGCSFIFIAERFKKTDYVKMLNKLIPNLSTSDPESVSFEDLPLRSIVVFAEDDFPGMMSWKNFIQKGQFCAAEELQARKNSLGFDDPINIQYTSGTTGHPKGATLSHHNILNNGFFVADRMNFTNKDRVVIPVPLYHCFGMVIGNIGCMTHGATMIYPDEGFSARTVLEAVEQEKATAVYGVPTMFIAELEDPEFDSFDLSSLRTGIMAGSPCPIEVMKKVKTKMHMTEVQVAYGMTETSPVSTQTKIHTSLEKQVGTVGEVHPHLEIKIIDPDNGKIVERGVSGELCTRGYSVMKGYWNNREQTKKAIDESGWMHSEDLAEMDADGFIKIVGRLKDMIIRGGENIYPREIEEYLYGHPAISDVKVIGVPDEKYGEEVMAWIKFKENEFAGEEELRLFCKGNIAHFKIPRYFKFTDYFPMTVTGKIRKVEMRAISIKELNLGKAENIKTA
jgi:fatty-acyl-CoA synthase